MGLNELINLIWRFRIKTTIVADIIHISNLSFLNNKSEIFLLFTDNVCLFLDEFKTQAGGRFVAN